MVAENKFAGIEDLTDEELEKLHNECRARAEMTLEQIKRRNPPTGKVAFKSRAAAHRKKIPALTAS